VAVTPWKSTSDINSAELVEPEPVRKRRSPARAVVPSQAGLDMAETAIERLEPLTPLALLLHGSVLITAYGAPAWLWAVLAVLLVFSLYDLAIASRAGADSVRVRAIVVMVAGSICFWSSGGSSSPFFVWLLVCVCVYPLLLLRFPGMVYVLSSVIVCLVGQWVAAQPLPALELLAQCGLLCFIGFLMHALGVRLKSFEHFQNLANIDSLTQVATRRRFFERAECDYAYCASRAQRITVMVFDLDCFKEINDNYGHGVGDELLRRFGKSLRRYARRSDVVGRLGGDEFAVFLPNTGLRGANDLLRRLRIRLVQEAVRTGDGDLVSIKTSVGVSTMNASIRNLEELMELADRDLYRQKLAGNQRVGMVSRKILKPKAG